MRVVLVGTICGALATGSAQAQTAAFKCPKPGLVIQYEDGGTAEAVSEGQNSCRFTYKRPNENATVFDWYAPMAFVSTTSTNGQSWLQQVKPQALWPLAVGKKLSARYDGASNSGTEHGSWSFTFTVEKYERITTKAGTFDTFLITRTQEGIGRAFKEKWSQWYAPELGYHVRYDYWNNQGRTNKGDAVAIKGQ